MEDSRGISCYISNYNYFTLPEKELVPISEILERWSLNLADFWDEVTRNFELYSKDYQSSSDDSLVYVDEKRGPEGEKTCKCFSIYIKADAFVDIMQNEHLHKCNLSDCFIQQTRVDLIEVANPFLLVKKNDSKPSTIPRAKGNKTDKASEGARCASREHWKQSLYATIRVSVRSALRYDPENPHKTKTGRPDRERWIKEDKLGIDDEYYHGEKIVKEALEIMQKALRDEYQECMK